MISWHQQRNRKCPGRSSTIKTTGGKYRARRTCKNASRAHGDRARVAHLRGQRPHLLPPEIRCRSLPGLGAGLPAGALCGWHAVRSATRRHLLEVRATAQLENAFLSRAAPLVSLDNRTRGAARLKNAFSSCAVA